MSEGHDPTEVKTRYTSTATVNSYVRATRSQSRPTSAKAISSISRSPTSPSGTQIKTNATTRLHPGDPLRTADSDREHQTVRTGLAGRRTRGLAGSRSCGSGAHDLDGVRRLRAGVGGVPTGREGAEGGAGKSPRNRADSERTCQRSLDRRHLATALRKRRAPGSGSRYF